MKSKIWPVVSDIEMVYCNIKHPLPYLWKHSYLAYFDDHTDFVKSKLFDRAYDVKIIRSDLDTAYVAFYSDHVVISFQGTNGDIKSWLQNFDLFPFKPREDVETDKKHFVDGGRIHDGFYDAWSKLKPYIDGLIESKGIKASQDTKPVFVTGHSRGGALAELCARHLDKNRGIKCSVITYGAPGVGNKEYRDEFRMLRVNGTRVRHGVDIVTYVPLRHGCANTLWLNKRPDIFRFAIPLRVTDHFQTSYDKYVMKKARG